MDFVMVEEVTVGEDWMLWEAVEQVYADRRVCPYCPHFGVMSKEGRLVDGCGVEAVERCPGILRSARVQ